MKITPEVAQAIANLRASRDWQEVYDWISLAGASWNQALISTDDADKRAVFAGMARAIGVIVDAVESAPQIVRDLKNGQSQ